VARSRREIQEIRIRKKENERGKGKRRNKKKDRRKSRRIDRNWPPDTQYC